MDCAQQPDFYGLNEFLYKETDSEYEYEGKIFRSSVETGDWDLHTGELRKPHVVPEEKKGDTKVFFLFGLQVNTSLQSY